MNEGLKEIFESLCVELTGLAQNVRDEETMRRELRYLAKRYGEMFANYGLPNPGRGLRHLFYGLFPQRAIPNEVRVVDGRPMRLQEIYEGIANALFHREYNVNYGISVRPLERPNYSEALQWLEKLRKYYESPAPDGKKSTRAAEEVKVVIEFVRQLQMLDSEEDETST